MSVHKIMAFAKAYETYNMLGPTFEYRQRAAKALVEALFAADHMLRAHVKRDTEAADTYRYFQRGAELVTAATRRNVDDALLELAVPLADSIVALNSEPEMEAIPHGPSL